jgi:signal transduction histidine kinase
MARPPLGQVRRPLRQVPGGHEQAVLRLVPVTCRLIHVVPRKLVHDQQRRQPDELVERRPERMHVVKNTSGDDRVERPVRRELLECHAPVQLAVRSVGIDGDHLIPRLGKDGSDTSLLATADLEHPRRDRGKLGFDVVGEVHGVVREFEHTWGVAGMPGGSLDNAERLRRLQAITDVALAHLTLDELLNELLVRIRDALDADTAAVLLLDETGKVLVARAAKGIEEEVERGVRIPVGKGFAGRIAARRRPVVLDDVDHADVLNPILREKGIKSMAGVPLIAHDNLLLGVVHVGTLTPREFTRSDVELLEVVAQRVAVAIERSLAHEQVLRMTELQRDFIALAAHELRNPAAIVYGLAATLARRDLSPELKDELTETLYAQSERMSRLVEQLLDMSRLDAASIEVAPQLVTLKPELEEIVRTSAGARRGDVFVETLETQQVVADRTVLERVVGNLVANALSYGAPPVHVSARQTDTHLRIVVSDSGAGIDPQFIPYLFERFRRSDQSRAKTSGAGLGLSIARSYARAHGGDLLYHAGGSDGAMFELVIPHTTPPT